MMIKLPQNKLALLYLLNELDKGCTAEQLSSIKEDYPFLNYFEMHLSLDSMLESGLLQHSRTPTGQKAFSLTDMGRNTLSHFQKEIPFSLRRKLSDHATELKKLVRNESQYLAEYRKIDNGQYIAELRVVENGITLLEIRLNLPAIEQVVTICDTWAENAVIIYQKLLKPLDNELE